MKNGSFDLAFRTMTIGLLMFLVLSIVSVGIHNLRPGSAPQTGPVAGTVAPPPVSGDSARTDEMRREFASSLARVSDRLAGIEQRFSTLSAPIASGVPTAEEARLQSAIESTQRRLEHLGDRLTDRIQTVRIGSEVELRDLNRQLSQMLDEQQQIQDQMVSVRVAAEHRLRPTRFSRSQNQPVSEQPVDRTARKRQDRLTENLEAMVSELASLREQLQSVRVAAANIDPENERVAISRKIPRDESSARRDREPETPVDRKVPDPADLQVSPKPAALEARVVEPPAVELPVEKSAPAESPVVNSPALEAPVTESPVAVESPALTDPPVGNFSPVEAGPTEAAAEPALPFESRPAAPLEPVETLEETIDLPATETIELPTATLPETSALPPERNAPVAQTNADAARTNAATTDAAAAEANDWEVPIAARPVSTIFPVDRRPGSSTQTPRGKSLSGGEQPATTDSKAPASSDGHSAIKLPLPAPTPVVSTDDKPSLPTPFPFPSAVAEITEPVKSKPAVKVAQQAPTAVTNILTPQEPRRLGGEIPRTAQRAPLRLADAPVVRPFEVPTDKPEPVVKNEPANSDDEGTSRPASVLSRFALTSSKSDDKTEKPSRGVTNAKWRAARGDSESDSPRPALRDSRSLFPIFRGKSSNSGAASTSEQSNAADSRIPEPLPLPRNLMESSANDRVSAPPLIEQASAELTGPARQFTVEASVLHITADDLTTVGRAGLKTLAVMGGHDFRVNQIRHAVRKSEAATDIYSGTVTVTGGVPTRIPIGWLCPHCNEESGVQNGDQLVITLPHNPGDNSATFVVEQADGTGRAESFRNSETTLIPGASVQITEAAQDGTVETRESESTPVLSRLPVIGEKFEKKSTQRQIMQRIIVLTVRELRDSSPQTIQQLSGQRSTTGPKVIHADMTAPATRADRRNSTVADSSGATAVNTGVANRRPAPPVED